jgi:catechol 2,3-dioxygenase-like lactoylglutathione lyase family enzyme
MSEQFEEKKTGTNHFVVGIGAVYVPVSDFWRSKKWYEEILDLKWGGHCFNFDDNQTSLFLIETKNHEKPHLNFISKGSYEMFILTLNIKKKELFEEFHRRIVAMGVRVENIENRSVCGDNFRLYDPDGNKIDIWNTDYRHQTAPQWESTSGALEKSI